MDPKLLKKEHRDFKKDVFKALANHLQRIKYILPEAKVKDLQKLPIWLTTITNRSVPCSITRAHGSAPTGTTSACQACAHPPRQGIAQPWPMGQAPYVILHELAHAYHDQVLEVFKMPIADAYNEIKKNGSYDKVLLYTGRTVKHYALTTPMEYFAESTEAYLGVNDFAPSSAPS